MPLPNPGMTFTHFDPLQASELKDLVEKIENLQDWSAFDDTMLLSSLFEDNTTNDVIYDFVKSGCVWSGDSYASTLNGSMTSGVVYLGGKRLTVAAVTAHAFAASKDTYLYLRDNGDGTASVQYNAVTNK